MVVGVGFAVVGGGEVGRVLVEGFSSWGEVGLGVQGVELGWVGERVGWVWRFVCWGWSHLSGMSTFSKVHVSFLCVLGTLPLFC